VPVIANNLVTVGTSTYIYVNLCIVIGVNQLLGSGFDLVKAVAIGTQFLLEVRVLL